MLKKISINGSFALFLLLSNLTGVMAMDLTSSVFRNGENIPQEYTCDGKDISPPLSWQNAPNNTKSFVLIMDDPDAPRGTWDHWLLFNIPAQTKQLAEGADPLPVGTQLGNNSWGKQEYGGACPPAGIHRYKFKLYALDTTINLPDGANKSQVEQAIQGHILAHVELMGRYGH
jgi:hypothetical protein